MQDFEKLGLFYLGKEFDPAAGQTTANLTLYDARDLTTHGVILGMTGSGKTGLALALIEEAAIDGIPVIAIDPKGDLGNLMLTFPALRPADFRPWIDPADATRVGQSVDELAAHTADTWRQGLAAWGQDGARIQRLRDAADIALYTPGSNAGRSLQILRSFAAPPAAVVQDATLMRDRIMAAVSGLLGLLNMTVDPLQSREHILLSSILATAWTAGRDLDLAALIGDIQKPPFDKVGVFDLETYYPAKERFGLAMALNSLMASPGFAAWRDGEPLDVQRLLYTPDGKPRVSIVSIAHLSDSERMFFVTLLLNEILAWTRTQSGTGSLRALLYMDEIFGYFPPSANPPSKPPMLALLKQARAFGLGIVLSTQNPVDLDYKGLANAGTWWIGRLQTERDKLRVIEGLEGAAAGTGAAFDRGSMEQMLAGLGNRVFLMRNVHEDQPVLMQSRWALSFLRGPMTLPQIQQLGQTAPSPGAPATPAAPVPSAASRPVLPPEIGECFRRPRAPGPGLIYRPGLIGRGKLHFVDAKTGVDTWITRTLLAPLGDDGSALWHEAVMGDTNGDTDRQPPPDAVFAALPAAAMRKQATVAWRVALETHLYQNDVLTLMSCPALKLTAQPGERDGDFKSRVAQALREQRDTELTRLNAKYAPRLQTLNDQIRRAQERAQREQAQAGQQKLQTVLSIGATLLGAFMGRRVASVGNLTRATSAMRNASRIGKEQDDAQRAGESVRLLQERLEGLSREFEQEAAALQGRFEPSAAELQTTPIRPRKSDITVGTVELCWSPWRKDNNGLMEPA